MNWKIFKKRTCLNLISAIILLVGLGSTALIYQRAGNDPDDVLGFENSKMYRHNLEVYGGKLNVIMDDFRRWVEGLWHGKSLAFIIGCSTIIISFVLFYAANYSIPRLTSADTSENDRDENRLE